MTQEEIERRLLRKPSRETIVKALQAALDRATNPPRNAPISPDWVEYLLSKIEEPNI